MAKIQTIKRKDGSETFLIYIPQTEIKLSELQKGDEVIVRSESKGKITIIKYE